MRPGLLLFLVLFAGSAASAQISCPPLPAPAIPAGANIFNGAQEMELGEIVRQQAEQEFSAIDEDVLTGYVKSVGARVASHLPDTGLRYEFVLYDRPEIQAFGMPGGRVYVSRKMVAFLRNEDELAGLLGHELGHMASRQQAIYLSQMFRDVLGIKSIGNEDDLYERYNELVDRMRLKNLRAGSDPEKGQEIADQLGVQAVARAGYAPQAFPDFLDRLMETKGTTGNWFSDLFSMTRPNSKRLRLALRDVANLPASCIEKSPAGRDLEKFHEWQATVLHYHGIGHSEHLPSGVTRVALNEPLRGDIETFWFSSDGKYLLAQDDGGIYVLSREPLQYVFRIDAPDAGPAQFSPDARHVVFFNHSQHVETWNVDTHEQESLDDVPAIHGCRETALSADARYLACFAGNLSLVLYDVPTGEIVLQMDKFFDAGGNDPLHMYFFWQYFVLVRGKLVTLRFSPDGHYFGASSRSDQAVLFDLIARRKLNVSGPLFKAMQHAFTFVGQDHLVGVDRDHPEKSPLIELPSEKVVDEMPLGGDTLLPATNSQFILAGPIKDHPIGAYHIKQKRIIFANRSAAADVWNAVAVSERLNGEIGLYRVGEAKAMAIITPPLGRLGTLRSVAVSPDLKWLVMSGRTRGGEWNLEKNSRVMLTRSFQRASYADDASLLLDFPSFEKIDRELVLVDPGLREARRHIAANDKEHIDLFGNVYLRTKSRDEKANQRNLVMEALDATSDKALWSHPFPKQTPEVFATTAAQRLVFLWHGKSDGLPAEIARNTQLATRWKGANTGEGNVLAEAVDGRDGMPIGGAVVHTGKYSFTPEYATTAGNALVLADNRNRSLLYSLESGDRKALWFGSRPRLSRDGRRLCLTTGRGRLAIYDLRSLKQTAEFSFAAPVISHSFSADSTKLFALTNDQTIFILDATTTKLN